MRERPDSLFLRFVELLPQQKRISE